MKKEHPVDVGLRHEALIVSELLRRGLHVLIPHGFNRRYDLVLDLDGRFLRVQCKSARLVDGAVVFRTESIRSNMRGTSRRGYAGEIEYFMAYCPATDQVYAIPIEEVSTATVALRTVPAANNQVVGIRMARDYLLDVILATKLGPAASTLGAPAGVAQG
jgi:PD-(D/E)XK endonuclease